MTAIWVASSNFQIGQNAFIFFSLGKTLNKTKHSLQVGWWLHGRSTVALSLLHSIMHINLWNLMQLGEEVISINFSCIYKHHVFLKSISTEPLRLLYKLENKTFVFSSLQKIEQHTIDWSFSFCMEHTKQNGVSNMNT